MENTPENVLGGGFTEQKLLEAIQRSGYPLQTHVAAELRARGFGVSPEWSYIDRDTSELRAIDMRASHRLWDLATDPRVRPHLELIIECKQSHLPFVFFTGEDIRFDALVPFMAGLLHERIDVHSAKEEGFWRFHLGDGLDFNRHPFFKAPPAAYTFSKCSRNGTNASLSGDEVYQGLILPLVKAAAFLAEKEAPPETFLWFDGYLTFPLAVVDAPMVSVEGDALRMAPWVRVLRHETGISDANDFGRLWAIDVVHKSFLPRFLDEHLIPFARHCADAILRHDREVAEGVATAEGLDENGLGSTEALLKPVGDGPDLGPRAATEQQR